MMVMPVALMGIVRIVVIRMVVMGKVLEPRGQGQEKSKSKRRREENGNGSSSSSMAKVRKTDGKGKTGIRSNS